MRFYLVPSCAAKTDRTTAVASLRDCASGSSLELMASSPFAVELFPVSNFRSIDFSGDRKRYYDLLDFNSEGVIWFIEKCCTLHRN